MARCEVKMQGSEITISGIIDDSFGVAAAALPSVGKFNVNLRDLKSINSTGIREWIKQMQKMKGTVLTFVECPKVFIDQVNMVQGFIPATSKIASFYVPFFNEENETEKSILFVHGQHFSDGKINPIPEVTDDKGAPMELDVIESKYFKFLKGLDAKQG